jgi:hypothetical protein
VSRASRRLAPALALLGLALARGAAGDGQPSPQPIDPGARLPAGASASEYWDLVAVLADGFRLVARFTISNEGPGDRSAAAFGHLLRPGAKPAAFQNGRREGRWRLSSDRRRIEIGSSLLDLSEGARHFEIDNDKRGVKLFLDWRADASARRVPAGVLPGGYAIDVLQLGSPVRASVRVPGMDAARELRGTLSLTHTWMPVAEGQLVLRRIDVASVEAGPGFYLIDLRTPAGNRSAWLSAAGSKVLAESGYEIATRTESSMKSSSYPIPSRLLLSAPQLRGGVTLGPAWLEVDPLAALPAPVRMVYSLRGRPHRSWTDAAFELSSVPSPEPPAARLGGDAIASLTFLDVFPPSQIDP